MSKVRPGCVSAMPQGMGSRSKRQTHFDRLAEDGAQGALRPGVQRMRRSTPSAGRLPNGRSDQPQPPDGCPVTEAINFQPQDGCPAGEGLITPTAGLGPRTKDQRQLRRFGPRCLRRTNVNSAVPAFPRGRPGESESSSGHARATGITHPGFYGRKPWKKPNSTLIINGPRPAKEGLRPPFRKPPPNRSLKLPANPPHSRPGYRHNSRRVIVFRSSRFLSALRVS